MQHSNDFDCAAAFSGFLVEDHVALNDEFAGVWKKFGARCSEPWAFSKVAKSLAQAELVVVRELFAVFRESMDVEPDEILG